MNLNGLPGADLIERGLADLADPSQERPSEAALLVAIGGPSLRLLGFELPPHSIADPEHRLYELLAAEDSDSAHSRYNALIRTLVSFERAGECVN